MVPLFLIKIVEKVNLIKVIVTVFLFFHYT
jgi:hypothetical protein